MNIYQGFMNFTAALSAVPDLVPDLVPEASYCS